MDEIRDSGEVTGTPQHEYVEIEDYRGPGSFPLLPRPQEKQVIAAPQISVSSAPTEMSPSPIRDSKIIPWAERLSFALLGSFLGTRIYWIGASWYHWQDILPFGIAAAIALFITYLLQRRSNYTKWAAIAITLTMLFPLSLLWGLQNLNDSKLLDASYADIATDENNQALFFIVSGIGMSLLAILAVLKSLRGFWRVLTCLSLILANIVGVLMHYSDLTSNHPFSGSLNETVGTWLFFLVPIALIILYMVSSPYKGSEE